MPRRNVKADMFDTVAPDQVLFSDHSGRCDLRCKPRWTVVLAFYNEALEIEATLRQLARQTRQFSLILVDNGSTDNSVALCHRALRRTGIDYVILREETPGQIAAFARGLHAVETELVATCDADTFYPRSYLSRAEALLDRAPQTVAACAYYLDPDDLGSWRATAMAAHQCLAGYLLPRQTHVGAAGQCFRTDALRAAGGYCPKRWPFVLGDHEVMHRVMKYGEQAMAWAHWCAPSQRRSTPVRWSFVERLAYHVTPFVMKDRYFRWLARRFTSRGLHVEKLRTRDWETAA